MTAQVTITTELSHDGLLALRAEIDALLGRAAPAPGPTGAGGADPGPVDEMARRLRARLNEGIQDLVRFIVKNYPDRTFTWDDVARDMGIHVETLKSWHRSLSKPLNRYAQEFPGAPRMLTSTWDGHRNHYTLSPEWREAIERAWA